jgi:hypothetical protein
VSKARKEPLRPTQQRLDALVVHHLGAVYLGLEHESFGVDQQMALSSFDLLASIVAAFFSAYPGSLDRLAIDYACAGLGIPLEANPH